MQTKTSYRVLKWMFLAGVASSLATACVVSSGDGTDDDTDFDDGGDGGTNTTTAGKGNTGGGGSSNAGTNSTDGGMPTMTDGGMPTMTDGGMPSTFVPGECQTTNDPIQPTALPVCDAADGDSDCIKCVKLQACDEYKTCFGEEPATACSVGMTAGAQGQFTCVTECFKAGAAEALDADVLLGECAAQCDECGSGGLNDETTDLIAEANQADTCQTECFPFE